MISKAFAQGAALLSLQSVVNAARLASTTEEQNIIKVMNLSRCFKNGLSYSYYSLVYFIEAPVTDALNEL